MLTETEAWRWASWDAVETLHRLRRREVSAAEVIEAAILRAQGAAALGAIVSPTFDAARGQAERAHGPLAGVPTFIKDLVQVRGVRTGWGSRGAGDYVSRRSDPEAVAVLRTGVVSLGKSATPEFGLTPTTEPLGLTAAHNPWNPAHSPGGSSGGAAALVVAGVVPIAHASDGGGSIRIPAACCGLVGLKPSRGRLDVEGSTYMPINLAVNGVVSRTVRDTVAFWNAIESQATDATVAPMGEVWPEPRRRLRIGVYFESPLGGAPDPEVRLAVEATAKQCEALGHHVELVPCPHDRQQADDFIRYWSFIAYTFTRIGRVGVHWNFDASRCEPWTLELARRFEREKWQGVGAIRRLREQAAAWAPRMERFDVYLGPTIGHAAPKLGALASDVPYEQLLERLMHFAPYTGAMNIIGGPGLSLPLGRSSAGLPLGVHFAAGIGQDALLLSLGLELEAAKPWERMAPRDAWASERPSVSA
jgi:amidase